MKKLLVSTMFAWLLVLALAGATFAAPAEKPLLFKGSIESQEAYVVNFPMMSVTATGSGHASQLGKFAVSYTVEVNLLTNVGSGGTAEFVAANGDSLFAAGSGQATETGTPGVFNIVENYTITGGTGRFAGASGTIILDRVVDIATGVTSGTMTGSIMIP